MLKIMLSVLAVHICVLPATTAKAAPCIIQFGDGGKTYPLSVNLDVGRATKISFDKKIFPQLVSLGPRRGLVLILYLMASTIKVDLSQSEQVLKNELGTAPMEFASEIKVSYRREVQS